MINTILQENKILPQQYLANRIIQGDALRLATALPDECIHCIVTSPPYWGLRDYGTALWQGGSGECDHIKDRTNGINSSTLQGGKLTTNHQQEAAYKDVCPKCGATRIDSQMGLEETPEQYIENMVVLFRELRRVLRKDGTLFLNMGDSFLDKQLLGMPWKLAFALQKDGWILRSDIIFSKKNPMPESVTDRPTKAHEYLFLLTKSPKYFYDSEAIREPNTVAYGSKEEYKKRVGNAQYHDGNSDPKGGGFRGLGGFADSYNPNGRNRRSVWEIATQPFNGAKILTDYVGTDGKPYTRSEDCPIHGLSRGLRTQKMGGYDEQLNQFEQDNFDNSNYHVQEPLDVSSSTHSPDYQNLQIANADEHILENTGENKTFETVETVEPQNHLDNLDIPEIDVYKSDLQNQPHAEIATGHNIQNHKTGHALVTSQPYTPSSESSSHIGDKSMLPLMADLVDHTSENKTARVGWDGHPLEQKKLHNVDKSSYRHGNIAKCTCQEVTIDHFATFPEALIEPCILAGTSAKGVCGECGGPWERVVKIDDPNGRLGKGYHDHKDDLARGQRGVFPANGAPQKITTGWQPTCKCPNNTPMPAIVLDPFFGSGTTGSVAKRLGRYYLGFELNPDYIKLATKRINNTQPPLFVLT